MNIEQILHSANYWLHQAAATGNAHAAMAGLLRDVERDAASEWRGGFGDRVRRGQRAPGAKQNGRPRRKAVAA